MANLPRGTSASNSILYEAAAGDLVYLIGQSVNGHRLRRLSAHYILNCLRSYRTPDEMAACLHALGHSTLRDLASEVEDLASELGLLTAPAHA